MSRLGNKPVAIPDKVKVSVSGAEVRVEGPAGKLSLSVPAGISVKVEEKEKEVVVSRGGNEKQARANHGTTRAHIANMMHGASEGFERILEIAGVGYNAQVKGDTLRLVLGYSHPIEMKVPQGLKVTCPGPTQIVVKGPDKQQVGQFAAKVRAQRLVEPYNLKGIKYRDEVVRKKAGKTFVTGG